jgi:glycosyltransferase involved in cell wall biosynthesis
MRILQVIPTIQAEGAQRVVVSLCRELRRAGHELGVVSLFDPRGVSLEAELRAEGVALHLLGKRMGPDLRMFLRAPRAAARFAPDVVHTHLYVLKYLLPGLALRRRVPIVHTVHNLAEREGGTRVDEWVQGAAFRAGVAAVAIGRAVAESMERLYRLAPRCTIPNGIPAADYAPPPGAREAVRAELGVAEGVPLVLAAGRLAPAKNHALALAALATPGLRALGAHLAVAGDGPLRATLATQARALEVADRVHLLGARPDMARVLAAADVFVLPSAYEGHPLAVMEAMAAGKPVVATAVGCVPETVTPESGRLVPAGDAAALSAALREVAGDRALARALGEEGRRTVRARFDSAVMARAYERLYRELVAEQGGRRAAAPELPA